jgi:thiamine biosynthesis lipoprotein
MHPPFPSLARRRFLALAASSISALGGSAWASLPSHRRESRALGATVSLTVLHEDASVAERAIDAAFAEIERIEAVLSLYRPESQICQLNREGVLDHPDTRLIEVLREAAAIAEKSGGAFDITVQPLWSLNAEAQKIGRVPMEIEVSAAREKVDWRRVQFAENRVSFSEKGTEITLNGIAQGYAADRARRVLREHGIEHALIDAGELGALGRDADNDAWQVGVQHPRLADAYAAVARLEGRCLATSGDYETSFSADFSRHHIFDPKTGISPGELASVSVLAASAMRADALSTTLMVLGAEAGAALLSQFPGGDALFILKDGRHFATAGFSQPS